MPLTYCRSKNSGEGETRAEGNNKDLTLHTHTMESDSTGMLDGNKTTQSDAMNHESDLNECLTQTLVLSELK